MRLSTPKRIVEKWIHRSRSRLPLGQLAGTLDWWVKERPEGMGRVEVLTVVNGGSKLLIFGPSRKG